MVWEEGGGGVAGSPAHPRFPNVTPAPDSKPCRRQASAPARAGQPLSIPGPIPGPTSGEEVKRFGGCDLQNRVPKSHFASRYWPMHRA